MFLLTVKTGEEKTVLFCVSLESLRLNLTSELTKGHTPDWWICTAFSISGGQCQCTAALLVVHVRPREQVSSALYLKPINTGTEEVLDKADVEYTSLSSALL